MDVVNAIVQGDAVETIRIIRIGKAANAFIADNATFQKVTEAARLRVKETDERKARQEEEQINRQWPGAKLSPKGARYVVTRPGDGESSQPGGKLRATYTGHYLDGRAFASSADAGKPMPGSTAEAFEYKTGKTKITPALDEALSTMKKGERRIVIAQGALGYGTAGFYAAEKPGEKRFVISPNTTLVYEVEVLEN